MITVTTITEIALFPALIALTEGIFANCETFGQTAETVRITGNANDNTPKSIIDDDVKAKDLEDANSKNKNYKSLLTKN